MRRTKEEALATRQAILKVALDCFSKRGYALTTFSDIAERIHLTKGAVFWHFKTKEDLLAELIVREHELYTPLKGIEDATSLDEVLQAFVSWAEALAKHRELRQFLTFAMSRVEWSDALKTKLKTKLDELMITDPFDRLQSCLAAFQARGLVKQELSVQQMMVLLASTFFGVHREAWLHKRDVDVLATVTSGISFVLQGIKE